MFVQENIEKKEQDEGRYDHLEKQLLIVCTIALVLQQRNPERP